MEITQDLNQPEEKIWSGKMNNLTEAKEIIEALSWESDEVGIKSICKKTGEERIIYSTKEAELKQKAKTHMEEIKKGCSGETYEIFEGEKFEFKCGTSELTEFKHEGIGFPSGTTFEKNYCKDCQRILNLYNCVFCTTNESEEGQ